MNKKKKIYIGITVFTILILGTYAFKEFGHQNKTQYSDEELKNIRSKVNVLSSEHKLK